MLHAKTVFRALSAVLFVSAAALPLACSGTSSIVVTDIVGKREIKPLEENPLICAAEDANKGDLSYTWSAEKGTIKGEGQTVTWTAPNSLGDYSVTVKVVSNKGGETTFSKKFKVTDDPYHNKTPDKTIYLNLTIPSDNAVIAKTKLRTFTTAEIQCNVNSVDPAGLTYNWTDGGGKLVAENLAAGRASRVGWIAPGASGFFTVTVVVSDKQGRQATGEVVVEVLCCRDP